MSQRYIPAASLTSSYLDASTPPGLFQVYRGSKPERLFLVISDDTGRHVIAIDEEGHHAFSAWQAEAGARAYSGVALGLVVLEVDTSSAVSHLSSEGGVGDVSIMPTGYWLACRVQGRFGITPVRVGDVAGGASVGPGHVFRRWRVVRPSERGEPLVLFERDADAEMAA